MLGWLVKLMIILGDLITWFDMVCYTGICIRYLDVRILLDLLGSNRFIRNE